MQTHNQNNYLNYNRLRTIRLNNEKDKILITTQDNGKPFPAEPLLTKINQDLETTAYEKDY